MFTVQTYQGADGQLLKYGKLTHPDTPDTGQALLFVPGLGGSVKGALDFLEKLLPYYSPIYGPDLRGFGLNLLEQPLPSARIIMDDLEAFHRQLGLDRHPALTLCGISMGGVISTILATQTPERYKKLILLAPAYRANPKSFTLRYTLRSILGNILQGSRYQTTLPYGVEALTRNTAILNDPQYRDHPPLQLKASFLLSVRSLNNLAFRKTRALTLPTQMFIPWQDVVCDPVAMKQGFERIPDSTPKMLKEYSDLYHDVLFEEEHADIAAEILKWSEKMDRDPSLVRAL